MGGKSEVSRDMQYNTGFPVLEGFFFQENVTAGVFYQNKDGIEFSLTVI
jgi:hypothetical protein